MSAFLPFLLFAAVVAVLLLYHARQFRALRERRRFIDRFDFHHLLDRRLAQRRPELDAAQRQRVFGGLREWFHVCNDAGRRPVSMPSQAVDDAWHEFILFTRQYQEFCRRGLGRFLHHIPAEAMTRPTQAQKGIRRSWRIACQRAGIDRANPTALPLLFALDAELEIPDGFRYSLDCLRAGGAGNGSYCASHIGCSSCGTGGSDCGSDGDGGGCGGD